MASTLTTTGPIRFADRREAGRRLAERLAKFRRLNPVVIGVAPSAMPIAAEIAEALDAPLDTVAVASLAIGATRADHVGTTAEGGIAFFDAARAERIDAEPEAVDAALIDAQQRVEQRTASWHRGERRRSLSRRNVLLVAEVLDDDQVAAAAACAVRDRGAAQVTYVAAKVRLAAAIAAADWMDEIVCLETVGHAIAACDFLERCAPVTDEEVRSLLDENARARRLSRETGPH